VLVVDDEDAIRSIAEESLQNLGFETIACCDGLEAIEVFERRRREIRLVLLDLVMPKLDGTQTLKRLLEIDPDVRVILSSGYPGETGVGRDLPEGAVAFLGKPYRLEELTRVVVEILGRDAAGDAG
jgi:CheY-like chemotaxis protein